MLARSHMANIQNTAECTDLLLVEGEGGEAVQPCTPTRLHQRLQQHSKPFNFYGGILAPPPLPCVGRPHATHTHTHTHTQITVTSTQGVNDMPCQHPCKSFTVYMHDKHVQQIIIPLSSNASVLELQGEKGHRQ